MKRIILLFTLVLTNCLIFAQVEHYDTNPRFSHFLTAEEHLQMYDLSLQASRGARNVPPAPVTSIAEFQPMEAVLIAYPLGIPVSLVRSLSQITQVKVLCDSQSQINTASNYFSQNGVNVTNVTFWNVRHDSYWVRDYGPWFILDGNDSIAVIDFTYNRPARPNDDASLQYIVNYMNIAKYDMPMVHTGGNYMSDGYGTAASTQLVVEENPTETISSLRQIAQQYLGVNQYLIVDDPMDDYIFHIDCWGKFLAVDKVLIGQVPVTDYRYADYEAAAAVFANTLTPWGDYYKVYRVYSPGGSSQVTPYTNSLIINDHVFVPQTGSSWDDDAIAVYEEAMPGYTIVPVMDVSYTPWENTDALHCRTHEMADRKMLYIKHFPLLGAQPADEQLQVSAAIKPLSGQPLLNDSVLVFYRVNHGGWQALAMSNVGGEQWKANFPVFQDQDTVDYYLMAKDLSGKREKHPYIGAADPHRFVVQSGAAVKEVAADKMPYLLYPNPATDHFVIKGDNLSFVKVYNAVGQLVMNKEMQTFSNVIDCQSWPAGVYQVIIFNRSGQQLSTKKIVKM